MLHPATPLVLVSPLLPRRARAMSQRRHLVRSKSVVVTIAIRPERNVVDVRSHSPLGLEQVTPCMDRKREQDESKERPRQHDPHHLLFPLEECGQIASIIGMDHRQGNPPGALPPRSNAIDATIHVATGIVTDRSTRHRSRPEHDARAGNAPPGITLVCAVHDRFGWRWIEGDTCKPQHDASSDPGNSRRFDRKALPRLHDEFLFAIANERWMGAASDAAAAEHPHHFGHGRLCTLMGGLVPDHPNSEIKSGIVVPWCIVPKYRDAMATIYDGA
jgi:hypothetical protein